MLASFSNARITTLRPHRLGTWPSSTPLSPLTYGDLTSSIVPPCRPQPPHLRIVYFGRIADREQRAVGDGERFGRKRLPRARRSARVSRVFAHVGHEQLAALLALATMD